MPFPLQLALRYLKSTRRDAFASFLSAVAAIGLALGVAALVLSLAALSGFQAVLKSEVLDRTPRLEVELPVDASAEQVAAVLTAVREAEGVESAQVAIRGNGWIVAEGGIVRPVEAVGFAGRVPPYFPGAAGGVPGLYLDDALAARFGVDPGESVDVVSPHPTLVPFGPPQPRVRSAALAGTFERPLTQEDRSRIALPLEVAVTLFPGAPRLVQGHTDRLERSVTVAEALRERLPGLAPGAEVRSWREINRSLFFVLRLEKALMFVAVSLVVLVAAFALVADLALIVSSKRSEIGMLGAMGAPAATIRRAFVLLGASLATLGAGAGALLGVGGAWMLDRYRVLSLPGEVYIFDYVPFLVRPADVAVVLGLAALLSLGFSSYAAQRAAALDPVEALRR
ncbi:MAG TPA: FtsX-like permease family protein [Thermoanaerobaculia bacterium]|nr:FtsX-like permease family protein [Thermoanaerobaculia bacterium]